MSLAEPPGVAAAPVPPLTVPPLITARVVVVSVCPPAVAVKSGAMGGSAWSTDAFPWGAGHGTLRWTHASEQAGKALHSQGHQCVVM